MRLCQTVGPPLGGGTPDRSNDPELCEGLFNPFALTMLNKACTIVCTRSVSVPCPLGGQAHALRRTLSQPGRYRFYLVYRGLSRYIPVLHGVQDRSSRVIWVTYPEPLGILGSEGQCDASHRYLWWKIMGTHPPPCERSLTTPGSRIGHVVTCRSARVSGLPWFVTFVRCSDERVCARTSDG